LWVVLLGPDGAGKSSVIASMGDGVAAGFSGCEAHHLRPVLVGNRKATRPNCNPHGSRPRGVLATVAKLGYLLAMNWAGYLLKVRPAVKRGGLVVFDRYFPDGVVDARRYRLPQSCHRFVAAVGKLVPQPDLYVVLDAPAEIARVRKCEVTHAEAQRQQREYRRLAESLACAAMVSAERPLPEVVNDVVERIIDRHLEQRRKAALA
jgi:thymidylate kinase